MKNKLFMNSDYDVIKSRLAGQIVYNCTVKGITLASDVLDYIIDNLDYRKQYWITVVSDLNVMKDLWKVKTMKSELENKRIVIVPIYGLSKIGVECDKVSLDSFISSDIVAGVRKTIIETIRPEHQDVKLTIMRELIIYKKLEGAVT